ncbi:NAD(P)-binding domain-containing protein [Cynara cardunculus var. scolymus]|uniref:NAD(P)-binding domain-containing protein n=1 Tax=Cynara cardunculus var. scolymus TaxID=59895 RepID=A0A124SC77_CYNCS|nr:NAD(P)-binding domain-containing protein [Cynara cardunculus var. scolymus]
MAGVLPSSISQYTLLYYSIDNSISNSKPYSSLSSICNAKKRSVVCSSSRKGKPGFFDVILDYIEGGPKLRKWYGAPDLNTEDGSILEEADESSEEDEVRDAVLVTDGDNEIGQSMTGDPKDSSFLKKSLRGVRAIICPNEGFLSKVESLKGVQHVVILSLLAEQDEAVVVASGIPYTIIRTGLLTNDRGAKLGFSFEEGCTVNGSLSKEDAAFVCIEALDVVPERGLVFEVVNGEEKILNWKDQLTRLMEQA